MKVYSFEIYTCDEITGESGWDIKFRYVIADSLTEAKEILKTTPYFDVIILWNRCFDFDLVEDDLKPVLLKHGWADE